MTTDEAAECPISTRAVTGAAVVAQAPVDFETVYRDNVRFVWRTARRLGIQAPFLDDVVQETFVVVHRRLADFGWRSTIKTWLYGIVRRVVADHRRVLRRKPGHCAGRSRELEGRSDGAENSPEASMERTEQVRLLHRLLQHLDEDKREVFVLAEIEEMTLAEIAGALGANANTVASRLRAARRQFEEALERLYGSKNGTPAASRRAR